jgi:hypothetical protein
MLGKQESLNFITSCQQVESCVLKAPVDKVWCALREFKLEQLLSSHIKGVNFVNGNPNEVGSVFEVTYQDGSVWTSKIQEISDSRRAITWELISTNPEITFSSMWTTIRLFKVTEDNTTFLQWQTDYSNDVNSHITQDAKYKKLDYFNDLKKLTK